MVSSLVNPFCLPTFLLIRFYKYANDGLEQIPRTPYMNNKIAQLNAVVRAVVPSHGVVPFELGHVLSGYLQDREYDRRQHDSFGS